MYIIYLLFKPFQPAIKKINRKSALAPPQELSLKHTFPSEFDSTTTNTTNIIDSWRLLSIPVALNSITVILYEFLLAIFKSCMTSQHQMQYRLISFNFNRTFCWKALAVLVDSDKFWFCDCYK